MRLGALPSSERTYSYSVAAPTHTRIQIHRMCTECTVHLYVCKLVPYECEKRIHHYAQSLHACGCARLARILHRHAFPSASWADFAPTDGWCNFEAQRCERHIQTCTSEQEMNRNWPTRRLRRRCNTHTQRSGSQRERVFYDACLKVRVESAGVLSWHACRHRHRCRRWRMPLRLRLHAHDKWNIWLKNTSTQTLTPPQPPPSVTAAKTDWMARHSLAQIESDRISIIQAFPCNSDAPAGIIIVSSKYDSCSIRSRAREACCDHWLCTQPTHLAVLAVLQRLAAHSEESPAPSLEGARLLQQVSFFDVMVACLRWRTKHEHIIEHVLITKKTGK